MASSQRDPSLLQWGIVSTGKICNDFATSLAYLRDYMSDFQAHLEKKPTELVTPDIVESLKLRTEIVAVAARSSSSAEEFAKRFKIPKAYGDYGALFSDTDVDVVYIGTIHPKHKEMAIQALKAKKHVVCEKPLGMNLKEVLEIQKCAKENDCFLLEAVWTRFMPLYKNLKTRILDRKEIGDVKFLQADFGVPFPREVKRIWDLSSGGGALLDIGIYPVANIPWIFGADSKPETLKIDGKLDQEAGVDIVGTMVGSYSDNKQAVVSWNALCQTPEEVVITGTAGLVRIHGPAHCPSKATVSKQNGRDFVSIDIHDETPNMKAAFAVGNAIFELNFPNSELLVYEVLAAQLAIFKGEKECADYTWADSRAVCELMDTCRREIGVVYPQDL